MRPNTRVNILGLVLTLAVIALPAAALAQDHVHSDPVPNFLSAENREFGSRLLMQDMRGRMKPLDTYVRELSMKVSKREKYDPFEAAMSYLPADTEVPVGEEAWEPLDFWLSWISNPQFWFDMPVIAVRFPGVKDLLGVSPETKWVTARSLITPQGEYKLQEQVNEAFRTPDRDRGKLQRKLLEFNDRFNIFYNALSGGGVRFFPMPNDANNTWVGFDGIESLPAGEVRDTARKLTDDLIEAAAHGDNAVINRSLQAINNLQHQYGSAVLSSDLAIDSELWLNRSHPFRNVTMPYFAAFVLLLLSFFWSLARRRGEAYSWKHPLFLLAMATFIGSFGYHLYAYVLRWLASGRAPLSNGYESLIFIALATAFAGLMFELKDRRGSAGGVSALLTAVVLGVAMLSTFNPDIGPLVPVLASYWLNIHVTIITGSYGFLGVGSLLGALTLILILFKGPNRPQIREAIYKLDRLSFTVLVTGLGLLSVGTLLGGVWANESWGRYWGWDPKETWSLVTILVYAIAIHFRWIPAMNRPWVLASCGFASIASVVMTYFGVNYFLSGLHSYGGGASIEVPDWVFTGSGLIVALILVSYLVDRFRTWGDIDDA
jgi:cytochrome c-type biogenesis protein CcsB